MAKLTAILGPPGSGKSQIAHERIQSDPNLILADVSRTWENIRSVDRIEGEDGRRRLPIREDDEPVVQKRVLLQVQTAIVKIGLGAGMDVIVTGGSPTMAQKWSELAAKIGASFSVETHDPGIDVVTERLSVDGELSVDCQRAIRRWYG